MNRAICLNNDCTLRDKCSHAIIYNDNKDNEVLDIINPQKIKIGEDGKCQFYCEPKTIIFAKGFKTICDNMPKAKYDTFSNRMQREFNHTDFFEMRRGKKLMSPYHQERFLRVCNGLGLTFPDSPWDETIEEISYFG